MPKTKDENTAAETKAEVEVADNKGTEALEARLGNLEALLNKLTETNDELKKENEQLREQVKTETESDAAIDKANAYMQERVPVTLFKGTGKYKEDVTCVYNGINYQIQRGKTVYVPRAVAAIIRQSEEQDRKTQDMIEELEREYEEKSSKI